MKVQNYTTETPSTSSKVFGTNAAGNTVNYDVTALLALNQTPTVDVTNDLTAATLTNVNTYFTGTAGPSFTINLPPASSGLDGIKFVIMSTAERVSTSWASAGAGPCPPAGPTSCCRHRVNSCPTSAAIAVAP